MTSIRQRLEGASVRLAALTGRCRAFAAIALGALSALAFPPVYLLPVLLIAFPALMVLADSARRDRGAFWVGWGFGFGHFSASLYWIANALLLDPVKFGWMIPFAVFGLGGLLGLFIGLALYGARRLMPTGPLRIVLFAALWMMSEWLRTWLMTGFSWNQIASVWVGVTPVLQGAALFGSVGLGFFTVLAMSMPALLVMGGNQPRWRPGRAVLAAWLPLILLAVGGLVRTPFGAQPDLPGVRLRLVQGNIPQTVKWQPELLAAHLQDYLHLSAQPTAEPLSAVIWPETAIAYLLDQNPGARGAVAQAAPPHGLVITGVPRATPMGQEPFQVWNSVQAVDEQGRVVGSYDKAHLVPFGEYVPLGQYLPLVKVTTGRSDFTPGPGPRTLTLPGLPPVAPSICYEDIFPDEVAPRGDQRPAWMLNVTNDGWFGNSAGPYQHFAAARLRAVEEGLAMVRVGNTGVTGIIDPFGRVTVRLELGERGVLDGMVPQAVAPTPYARMGNKSVFLLLSIVVIVLVLLRRGSARN